MSPLLAPSVLLTALVSLSSSVSGLSLPPRAGNTAGAAKAIYFITNDDANAVVALPVTSNGMLARGTVTATGGAGAVGLDANRKPAMPDALRSQSALTRVGNTIFAVNAGSNTLSMLSISPSDPTCLTLVGKPVPVPGDFPTTVAASAKHNLACVGTAGTRAGIACSSFSAHSGLAPMDALRPFAGLNQTTPPTNVFNTISQVFFSADQGMLFATVKGNPTVMNNPGFFASFPVQASSSSCAAPTVARTETRSSPNGTAVLFGAALVPDTDNRIFVTDASFGGAVLAVDPATGKASTLAKGAIADQKATCWAALSAATGSVFVSDGAANRVVEMSLADAKVMSVVELQGVGDQDPGLLDLAVAGGFVYALKPGNGSSEAAVVVLEARPKGGDGKPMMVQRFGLKGVADGRAMGMSVLV